MPSGLPSSSRTLVWVPPGSLATIVNLASNPINSFLSNVSYILYFISTPTDATLVHFIISCLDHGSNLLLVHSFIYSFKSMHWALGKCQTLLKALESQWRKTQHPLQGVYNFWSQMGKSPNYITSPSRQHSKLKPGVPQAHKGRPLSLLPGSCPRRPGVWAESERISKSGLAKVDEAGFLGRDAESVWDSMTHSGNSSPVPDLFLGSSLPQIHSLWHGWSCMNFPLVPISPGHCPLLKWEPSDSSCSPAQIFCSGQTSATLPHALFIPLSSLPPDATLNPT